MTKPGQTSPTDRPTGANAKAGKASMDAHRKPTRAELDEAAVEAIAYRVVELLREEPQGQGRELMDAKTVALRFGLSLDWVYDHAKELGAIPLGDGPRPRKRFDAEQVARALDARRQPVAQAPGKHRRRRRGRADSQVPLLPITPRS